MTHLQAKLKEPAGLVQSVILVPSDDVESGGVYRYLLTEVSGQTFPCSRDWHSSEESVKQQCADDFDVRDGDWEDAQEDPVVAGMLSSVNGAADEAITSYLGADKRGMQDDE